MRIGQDVPAVLRVDEVLETKLMTDKNAAAEQTEAPRARRLLLPIIDAITQGMKVAWPIFNDVHPGEALSAPFEGYDDKGRKGMVVKVLVERTNQQGGRFTKIQNILEPYVFQCPEGLEATLITGDVAKDLVAHAERNADFRESLQNEGTVA